MVVVIGLNLNKVYILKEIIKVANGERALKLKINTVNFILKNLARQKKNPDKMILASRYTEAQTIYLVCCNDLKPGQKEKIEEIISEVGFSKFVSTLRN